jgi:hypothetical protein
VTASSAVFDSWSLGADIVLKILFALDIRTGIVFVTALRLCAIYSL